MIRAKKMKTWIINCDEMPEEIEALTALDAWHKAIEFVGTYPKED